MEISTNELKNKILNAQSIQNFINDNKELFVSSEFSCFINEKLKIKKLKKNKVAAEAQISKTYLYELFSGKRTAPSRDVCVQLIFGLKLSPDEGDQLLQIAGYATLYPRDKRDAIILYCLHKKLNLVKANILLEENQLLCLTLT